MRWGRSIHQCSHGPGSFADVWSLGALDDFLANTPRRPLVRLVKNGNPIPPDRYTRRVRLGGDDFSDAIDPSSVVALFDGGATVVTQSLHRTCTSVRRFVTDLAAEVSHPVQANSYLTPPDSTGLAPHTDRHDVFVVQVHGSKRWAIAGHDPITLLDGDVLYIPAGVEHRAHATDQASLHLTIGLIRTTYRSVIERALRRGPSGLDDPLPLRYADDAAPFSPALVDRIASVVETFSDLDASDLEVRERERNRVRAQAMPSIARSVERHSLDAGDVVRRSCDWIVSRIDEQVLINAGSRWLRAPVACEPAVRQLDRGDPVGIGELSGLDLGSRLILARRLVAADLCAVARGGG